MKVAMWLGGARIRAYECPRWSARCRLQEDPQTTRHKAERHEEVRAHEDGKRRYSAADARIVSVDHQFFTRVLPR
jgi:hypothetical protein